MDAFLEKDLFRPTEVLTSVSDIVCFLKAVGLKRFLVKFENGVCELSPQTYTGFATADNLTDPLYCRTSASFGKLFK